jgi:hypothetical protein
MSYGLGATLALVLLATLVWGAIALGRSRTHQPADGAGAALYIAGNYAVKIPEVMQAHGSKQMPHFLFLRA